MGTLQKVPPNFIKTQAVTYRFPKLTAGIHYGSIPATIGAAICGRNNFASFPMDETHLLTAARYVEMNPIKAGLAERPKEYLWSSARAHLACSNDQLVNVLPLLEIAGNWRHFLDLPSDDDAEMLRRHEKTGRHLGDDLFVESLESATERLLRPQKRGPKKRNQ